ncbi:hypothetical protein [Paenibacillus campi]|uniref:hypothetical protein n=1 Tax=Paenibacillus campi TaxID=3106031 RepID=UPI002AFF95D4|nr:hypothetical protein [Paenibacillus sp. SGZ-1009]
MAQPLKLYKLDQWSELTNGSFVIPLHERDAQQRQADQLATTLYIQNKRKLTHTNQKLK